MSASSRARPYLKHTTARLLLLLLCCCWKNLSFGQELRGTVRDDNKQPLPGATVYLNGTSIWAITDENGQYQLTPSAEINTELIVSALGFEPYALPDPYARNPAQITLKPATTKLREVNVRAPLFTRKQMLRRFREEFLGRTKAGKSCKIKNEDALYFDYDPKTFVFKTFADEPLVVENHHLGFEMEFTLVDFYINFRYKTLNPEDIRQWLLSGTTLYREFPQSKKYDKARAKSYEGSQMQFFRLLTRGALQKENFRLYVDRWPRAPQDCFAVSFEGGMYKVTVLANDKDKTPEFRKTFDMLYKNNDQSALTVRVPEFHVDKFGNYDNFEMVNFSGAITQKRAGDLLPADYQMKP